MLSLKTSHPTMVQYDHYIDPSVMDTLLTEKESQEKRRVEYYGFTDDPNHYSEFVRDVSSSILDEYGFEHNKDVWYMDVIRYNLKDESKRVKSGLAWHCEDDNYPNVITVLHYLRLDEGIVDGNLKYKDTKGTKCVLPIKSGTTVIMDGQVPHKPQDPYGNGIRELVIVSFKKKESS